MFRAVFYPLADTVKAFNVFQYISFRAAYAAVTALLIAFLLGPKVIQALIHLGVGQQVRTDGPKTHLSKEGTPTMGGILIIFSFVISVLLWQKLNAPSTWIILLTALGFGCIGFVDDWLKIKRKNSAGLQAKVKLYGQFIVAFAVMVFIYTTRNPETTLLYIPFLKNSVLDLHIFYIPFGVLLLVGVSNSVNLADGLDGLATGLVIIVLLAFTVLAYLTGHVEFANYLFIPYIKGVGELTISSTALLGACVGFLWFNSHPAEMFLGDSGSLTLGALLASLSLLLKKEMLLLIIGGVFMLEVLSVIIQVVSYKLTRQRVFLMAPIHHHFEMMGWKETKVVVRFWILGCLFAILGLSTLKIQ
ncbi:MAG: phospho-N-acetylmuramoyl-pentapeptide-transferase [Spirochaeta sp. LUC14_002_19_P3]|nr:MAG: phospho-N-acetylmuramoyl-pentapeptide-transferase [Spirochaeta sp. LUC14_002_19_P3]